jgi:hypothetical protein
MKVKELIEALLKHNQDAEVGISQPELKWTVCIKDLESFSTNDGKYFLKIIGNKIGEMK